MTSIDLCEEGSKDLIDSISLSKRSILNGFFAPIGYMSISAPFNENSPTYITVVTLRYPIFMRFAVNVSTSRY